MLNDDEVVTKNRDIQLSLRTTQSHDDYDVHVQNLQNAIPDSGPACHAIPIKKHPNQKTCMWIIQTQSHVVGLRQKCNPEKKYLGL